MGLAHTLGLRRGRPQRQDPSDSTQLPRASRLRRRHRPRLEPLEDRTLLSINYGAAATDLVHIFDGLQTSLNANLLSPATDYSLPLVGKVLGQSGDKTGQFLTDISNQIPAAFNPAPMGAMADSEVTADLNAALKNYNGNATFVKNTGTEADFMVTASGSQTEKLALQLGLPALSSVFNLFNFSVQTPVNVTVSFSMNLYFGIDATGVFVDPSKNDTTPANSLLSIEVKANLGNSTLSADLNGIQFAVTDKNSTLDIPVTFNLPQNGNVYASAFTGNQNPVSVINVAANAAADVNLQLTLAVADAVKLTANLDVQWPLTSTQAGISPFATLADGNKPGLTFDLSVDLSSFEGILDPKKGPLFQKLQSELQPAENIVNFFFQPIPVISDLGIKETPYDILSGAAPSLGIQPELDLLDFLHTILSADTITFTAAASPVALVHVTLDPTLTSIDLRDGSSKTLSDLTSLLENTAYDVSGFSSTVDSFLGDLGHDLHGIITAPALDHPELAIAALLNPTGTPVVLFQYKLNDISIPASASKLTIGPFGPLVPPFPIFISFGVGFGIDAGFTLGYSSYGFTSQDPINGFFLQDVHAELQGSIILTGELKVPFLSVGASGTLTLSLGIMGIDTSEATHTLQTGDPNNPTETVLQLDDFVSDVSNGGPLCPFSIGGKLDLSFSLFVKIGVDPFSIQFDVPLGDITLASFTFDSCNMDGKMLRLADAAPDLTKATDPLVLAAIPDITKKLPQTQRLIVLDMGALSGNRVATNDNDPYSEESYEVFAPPKNPTELDVEAFGAVQKFNDINWNDPGTTIVILGDEDPMKQHRPESVLVDPGVKANAYFIGGPVHNSFTYLGGGDTYMRGGTWLANQGSPSSPNPNLVKLNPVQTLNTFQGGYGKNTLIGGDLIANGYTEEKNAAWNMLVASPAANLRVGLGAQSQGQTQPQGQPGGHDDTLEAGRAGATMQGGDLGNDTFNGSNDPTTTSSYVMIAGKDPNNHGPDTMNGGYGTYTFEWQQGDAALTVNGNQFGGQAADKTLEVWGNQPNENWDIHAEGKPHGVYVQGQDGNKQNLPRIDAYDVQTVSVDVDSGTDPSTITTGGENYTVDDLTGTGVTKVNLNLHQWLTGPDTKADNVTINGPNADDTVKITTVTVPPTPPDPAFDPNTGPIYVTAYSTINITAPNPVIGILDFPPTQYEVDAALPKASDTLSVYTQGGKDNIFVARTQPDQGYVSTGAGDDTITVGDGVLDDIEGPLVVDAGSGDNQITFNESSSKDADIATLTTNLKPVFDPKMQTDRTNLGGALSQQISQEPNVDIGYLYRYKGVYYPAVTLPAGTIPAHYRFQTGITFLATGGDYANGMFFDASASSNGDQIYVDSVLPNAPTTVGTDGGPDNVYVGFDGGATSATSDPNSTLDYINSEVTVSGDLLHAASLLVDDEGTPRPDTYDLTALTPQQPNGTGFVFARKHLANVKYEELARVTVKAAFSQDNTINVTGTVEGTPTTVLTGNGNNSILVGDPEEIIVPPNILIILGYNLDNIQGPLTITGGTGTDDLMINDNINSSATYDLSATMFQRFGGVSIAPITFTQMTTLELDEPRAADTLTDVSGTAQGTTVTVYTGNGTDSMLVNTLNHIQGPLTLVWSSGIKSMLLDDSAAPDNETYGIALGASSGTLTRSGAATISFNFQGTPPDPLSSLILQAGLKHEDTVDVLSTSGGTQTDIFAGTVVNRILVGDPNQQDPNHDQLDVTQGQVDVLGQGFTQVEFDDLQGPSSRTYTQDIGSLLFNTSLPRILISNINLLVLDAAAAATVDVVGLAASAAAQLNLSGMGSQVNVGSTGNQLLPVQGRVEVEGTGTDGLAINDQNGPAFAPPYFLTASGVVRLPAQISYHNIKSVQLNGALSVAYDLLAPPVAATIIQAQGPFNALHGPNLNSNWRITGPDVGMVDASVTFNDIGTLLGGSANDLFGFASGASLSGRVDGGTGTDALAFGSFGGALTVTLQQDGSLDGVRGTATPIAGGFDNIDQLVGDAGSTLDGSFFVGDFTPTLTAAGFDTMQLNVPGNFTGSLLAAGEGTPNLPVKAITIGGTMGPSAVIKTNFLQSFSVTGDMDGVLKGFGLVGGNVDNVDPTIQSILIGGTFGAAGQIIAPTISQAIISQFGGHIQETEPTQDMQLLDITGSLLATGTVQAGSIANLVVGQDLAGQVHVAGPIGTITVGGSLTGGVTAGSIGSAVIDGNLTGQLTVTGTLGSLTILGTDAGHISAGQVSSLGVRQATGAVLLDITQNGVERELLASVPGSTASPNSIVSYFYDGTTSHPEVVVDFLEGDPDQPLLGWNLSLVVHGPGQFDLARLDCLNGNHVPTFANVQDVAIEGDLLNTVSPAALAFFGLPAGTSGGIALPLDNLGSVAASGNINAGSIAAHSIETVAFGTATLLSGSVVGASAATAPVAAALLAPGTSIVQANGNFAIPFGAAEPAAFFLDTQPTGNRFDANDVLFADQIDLVPSGPNTLPPGPCLATLAVQFPPGPSLRSMIQTISLAGDGGALSTAQPIGQSITSTGPLGDLVLLSPQGLRANVTAPMIFGNILVPIGPIAGTIQTTGRRINPVTGAATPVTADLGRVLLGSGGDVIGVTEILAGLGGIPGQIISRGNLPSTVVSLGSIPGVIAAQGDIGAIARNPDGSAMLDSKGRLIRFGGIVTPMDFSGELIGLGNVYGDIFIGRNLLGRMAVEGRAVPGLPAGRDGILGNVTIGGSLAAPGAIVSAAMIGDAVGGTQLLVGGAFNGIVAVVGDINLSSLDATKVKSATFYGGNLGNPNAAAIDSFFQSSFDQNPGALDSLDLDLMLNEMADLHVAPGGILVF
jgi:hypothetical protein